MDTARVPLEGFPWQLSTDMPLDLSQKCFLAVSLVLGAGGAIAYLVAKEPMCRSSTRRILQQIVRCLEDEESKEAQKSQVGARFEDVSTVMRQFQRRLHEERFCDRVLIDQNFSSTPTMLTSSSKPSQQLSDSMREMVYKASRVRQLILEASLHSTDPDYTLSRLDISPTVPCSQRAKLKDQDKVLSNLTPVKNILYEEAQLIKSQVNFWHLTDFSFSSLLSERTYNADLDLSLEVEVDEEGDPWEWDNENWDGRSSSPCSRRSSPSLRRSSPCSSRSSLCSSRSSPSSRPSSYSSSSRSSPSSSQSSCSSRSSSPISRGPGSPTSLCSTESGFSESDKIIPSPTSPSAGPTSTPSSKECESDNPKNYFAIQKILQDGF